MSICPSVCVCPVVTLPWYSHVARRHANYLESDHYGSALCQICQGVDPGQGKSKSRRGSYFDEVRPNCQSNILMYY